MVPRWFFRPLVASFLIGALFFFWRHVGEHAAALDHEARDHAMEDQPVEEAIIDIGEEILDGDRRLGGIQFEREGAQRGFETDHVMFFQVFRGRKCLGDPVMAGQIAVARLRDRSPWRQAPAPQARGLREPVFQQQQAAGFQMLRGPRRQCAADRRIRHRPPPARRVAHGPGLQRRIVAVYVRGVAEDGVEAPVGQGLAPAAGPQFDVRSAAAACD